MDKLTFPKDIRLRITDEFLTTFKDELDKVSCKPEHSTYWNYYQFLDGTGGFYKALEESCEIHNLDDLYWYLDKLPYYKSDKLDSSLTEMLYKRRIIKKGTIGELYGMYPNPFVRFKYKIYLYAYYTLHKIKLVMKRVKNDIY